MRNLDQAETEVRTLDERESMNVIAIDEETRGKLRSALTSPNLHLVRGVGTGHTPGVGERCTVAEIMLVLTGKLDDGPHPCISEVIRNWVIRIQDAMPDEIRNSPDSPRYRRCRQRGESGDRTSARKPVAGLDVECVGGRIDHCTHSAEGTSGMAHDAQ